MRKTSDVVYVRVDEVRFNQLTTDLDTARRVHACQSLAITTAGHDLRQHLQTIVLVLDLVRPALIHDEHLKWLATAQEQVGCLTRGLEALAREGNLRACSIPRKRSSTKTALCAKSG